MPTPGPLKPEKEARSNAKAHMPIRLFRCSAKKAIKKLKIDTNTKGSILTRNKHKIYNILLYAFIHEQPYNFLCRIAS